MKIFALRLRPPSTEHEHPADCPRLAPFPGYPRHERCTVNAWSMPPQGKAPTKRAALDELGRVAVVGATWSSRPGGHVVEDEDPPTTAML